MIEYDWMWLEEQITSQLNLPDEDARLFLLSKLQSLTLGNSTSLSNLNAQNLHVYSKPPRN